MKKVIYLHDVALDRLRDLWNQGVNEHWEEASTKIAITKIIRHARNLIVQHKLQCPEGNFLKKLQEALGILEGYESNLKKKSASA